jgi:hypothetical protein
MGNVKPNLAKVNGPGEKRERWSENSRVGSLRAGKNSMARQAHKL